MFSAALTAFLTGITEPIEFAFLFVAPLLYAVHALLAGAAYFVCIVLGIKHGFTFLARLHRLRRALSKIAWRALAVRPRADLGADVLWRIFTFAIRRFNLAHAGTRSWR